MSEIALTRGTKEIMPWCRQEQVKRLLGLSEVKESDKRVKVRALKVV
jgi:hypothetical protein